MNRLEPQFKNWTGRRKGILPKVVDEMGTGLTALMLYVSSSGSKGKMATYLGSNMQNQLVQKFIKGLQFFLWWLFYIDWNINSMSIHR